MSIEQIRARVIASVWQAVAQSGVDLSVLPLEQQEKLVNKVADSLLQTVNSILDEIAVPEPVEPELPDQVMPPAQAMQAAGNLRAKTVDAPVDEPLDEPRDDLAEKILWQGRPFLSLVEFYTLTSERVKIVRGLVSRDVENFELIRVQDIDLKQNVGERMMSIGDISIRGSDASKPLVVLRNVPKPEEVYELLRRAWLEARKRHGLQFREYM